MDIELCVKCGMLPDKCTCRPKGPIAIAMTTEPHHWSEPARSYLFTEAQIARDRHLNKQRS